MWGCGEYYRYIYICIYINNNIYIIYIDSPKIKFGVFRCFGETKQNPAPPGMCKTGTENTGINYISYNHIPSLYPPTSKGGK